jgi:hypothetical protein
LVWINQAAYWMLVRNTCAACLPSVPGKGHIRKLSEWRETLNFCLSALGTGKKRPSVVFFAEQEAGPFLYLTKTREIIYFRFGRTSYQILA